MYYVAVRFGVRDPVSNGDYGTYIRKYGCLYFSVAWTYWRKVEW